MKPIRKYMLTMAAAILAAGLVPNAGAQSSETLINKLVQKGILTEKEAKELAAETTQTQTNLASASKWKLSEAIKSINLYGDVRFRYEYRDALNALGSGSAPSNEDYIRERFRYALRIGLKGDLFDNFYYGLRLDTSSNPRSPWVTFGDDSNATPSAKNSDGLNIGQVYLGWKPTSWYEMTIGKMPMPLYVTPLLWDSDINPEGAAEKFKYTVGKTEFFANFGQFVYQDTNPDYGLPSSDTFLLAWQLGANVKLPNDMSFKIAPAVYNYTGVGTGGSLNHPFTGQGLRGLNASSGNAYNQVGINNLLVVEVPAEFNFKVGKYGAKVFGDFAYNTQGDDRAHAAYEASRGAVGGLTHAYNGEDKAYQAGIGFGNLGLVYGQNPKRNSWEARAYYQHVEQYAADVNLLDSDFFEGRGNLEGVYGALAYSITDGIIATARYGYASRINSALGTGGNNPDLPGLNPIRNYHLLQFDITWKF